MKDSSYKKSLVLGIFILFIGAGIIPGISGYAGKMSNQSTINGPSIFPLNNGYVNGFWKFDECSGSTAYDSSGHNYDGTIIGATWTSGCSGCGLDFDGVNDYVDLDSYSVGLGFNKTDDLIFSLCFRSTDSGIIYGIAGTQHNPEARIELLSNGTILIKIWTQVCGINITSENSFNDGDWHDVEIYFNGITSNPTVDIYVDGNPEGSLTTWLCDIENDDFSRAKIGRRGYEDEGYFDGKIDEFKIIKYPGGNDQNPPDISGPTSGHPGVEYEYTFVTIDPEGDDIQLYIDWDDGTVEDWDEWYKSGEEVTISHTWDVDDYYEIKAESRDIWDDSISSKYKVRIGNQPPEPPEITGPKYGDPNQELTFTFKTYDFENEDIKYIIDWDDGDITTTEYYPSNTSIQVSHSWETKGDYYINASAADILDKEGDPSVHHIRIGDQPPSKPKIYGAVRGIPDVEYDYAFISSDPENYDITYDIDWGDGNIETDIGPFPSGEIFTRSHSWDGSDNYIIKARAKDDVDHYSDWSEHTIYVPRNKALTFNLLSWLFERFPILECLLNFNLREV